MNSAVKFSESKVEYATHNLSIYHGECGQCRYCFNQRAAKSGYGWATGPLRINPKLFDIVKSAPAEDVKALYISFTCDPLPLRIPIADALETLAKVLTILVDRKIPTKVLTKNALIRSLGEHIAPSRYLTVGLSITSDSFNKKMRYDWERYTHPIHLRLQALAQLKAAGFQTWVSVEPILPNTDLDVLMLEVLGVKPDEIWIGKGNYFPELEQAFDWGAFLEHLKLYTGLDLATKIHIKRELLRFARESTIVNSAVHASIKEVA
jgi:DNA repair photolyase